MSGFVILLVVILLMLISCMAIIRSGMASATNDTSTEKNPIHNIDEDDDDDYDEWGPDIVTYIAGVNYRCDKQDIGGFVGTAVPERGNPHDRNAVAIYRHNDKKHIGYLPRDKAKEYRDLFGTKITPCAGYITYGNKAPLRSGVKILDPTDENRAETEMMAYIRWMVNTFGPDYCPPEVDLAE